jgi:hypothetical protein
MERWNEINFILSEKVKSGISESIFEKYVIEALRILGWSEYLGDLIIRPSINIGSSKRITPDIIVKKGDKKLFVIEIKKPGNQIKTRYAEQLTSYLRFSKLEVGIIIGEKIQLVYDDKSSWGEDAFIFEEIEFKMNNPKGEEFVRLFSKEGFNIEQITEKVKEKKAALEDIESAEKLKKELISSTFQHRLKELLKKELSTKYSGSIIEKVLTEINIYIQVDSALIEQECTTIKINREATSRNSLNPANNEIKIGKYVRETFNEVVDKIDRTELENLQRQDYSKKTFDLQFPFLRKVLKSDTQKPHRYWKEPISIHGERFFLCSEWYETPANNDRPYYEKWLHSVRKK